MIKRKFKGYTYTEYQNEMCDKAIEANEKALELYKKARNGETINPLRLESYAPQLIGISELNNRIKKTEQALKYLKAIRESNGQIIEPIYKSYWDKIYSKY